MNKMIKLTALSAAMAAAVLMQPVLAEQDQTAPTASTTTESPDFQAFRARNEAQRAERRAEMEQRREAMRATMTQERESAMESMKAERAAMEKVMEAERAAIEPATFTGNPADWQKQQIEAQENIRKAHEELNRLQAARFEQDQRTMYESMGVDYDKMMEQQKAAWEQHQAAMKKFFEDQQKQVSGS